MKTQRLRLLLAVLGLVLFATLSVVGALNAGETSAQGECTLSTIQGTYLFEGSGVTVQDGNVLPYAEAGVWTLDGAGNASGFISASTNGEPFSRREAFTATYEHTTDCVYAVVDQFGFEVDLYTSPSGNNIMYFAPGFSGTQIKQ